MQLRGWWLGFATITAAAAGLAHADPKAEPKVCATAPHDATPRALQIVDKDGVLVPVGDGEFPAISDDGKRITNLFVDKDARGVARSTVEIWEVAGPKEVGYDGIGGAGFDARHVDVLIRGINGQLAGKWKPIPIYKPCDAKGSRLQMGDGLAFSLKPGEREVAVLRSVHGADERRMRLRFDHLGTRAGDLSDGSGGDICGTATRIAFGFGGLAEGVAVIVPDGDLAADCFRSQAAFEANVYLTHGDGG